MWGNENYNKLQPSLPKTRSSVGTVKMSRLWLVCVSKSEWDWREVTVCKTMGLAWDENLNMNEPNIVLWKCFTNTHSFIQMSSSNISAELFNCPLFVVSKNSTPHLIDIFHSCFLVLSMIMALSQWCFTSATLILIEGIVFFHWCHGTKSSACGNSSFCPASSDVTIVFEKMHFVCLGTSTVQLPVTGSDGVSQFHLTWRSSNLHSDVRHSNLFVVGFLPKFVTLFNIFWNLGFFFEPVFAVVNQVWTPHHQWNTCKRCFGNSKQFQHDIVVHEGLHGSVSVCKVFWNFIQFSVRFAGNGMANSESTPMQVCAIMNPLCPGMPLSFTNASENKNVIENPLQQAPDISGGKLKQKCLQNVNCKTVSVLFSILSECGPCSISSSHQATKHSNCHTWNLLTASDKIVHVKFDPFCCSIIWSCATAQVCSCKKSCHSLTPTKLIVDVNVVQMWFHAWTHDHQLLHANWWCHTECCLNWDCCFNHFKFVEQIWCVIFPLPPLPKVVFCTSPRVAHSHSPFKTGPFNSVITDRGSMIVQALSDIWKLWKIVNVECSNLHPHSSFCWQRQHVVSSPTKSHAATLRSRSLPDNTLQGLGQHLWYLLVLFCDAWLYVLAAFVLPHALWTLSMATTFWAWCVSCNTFTLFLVLGPMHG